MVMYSTDAFQKIAVQQSFVKLFYFAEL